MAAPAVKELDLTTLRPKSYLRLRLMFEGAWKVLTLVGLGFGLAAIGGTILLAVLIAEEQRFERQGVKATATVTDKDTYRTRSDDHHTSTTHYRVYYRFKDAAGASHDGQGEVPRSCWEATQPGSRIEIEYIPSRPSRNRPAGTSRRGLLWAIVLVPAIFGSVAVVLLVIVGRRAARNATLLSRGTLTRGVVEEKAEETHITINDRHPFRVTYTFALPDGEVRTARDLVTDLAFAAKLIPGDPVGVVYLPADPARSALFRDRWMKYFQARRP